MPDAKTVPSAALRFLTDEDFERLDSLKRKLTEEEEAEIGGRVDPDVLSHYQKRQRKTLEERMQSVMEGRKDRYVKFERKSDIRSFDVEF